MRSDHGRSGTFVNPGARERSIAGRPLVAALQRAFHGGRCGAVPGCRGGPLIKRGFKASPARPVEHGSQSLRACYFTDGRALYRVLLTDVTAAVVILEDCLTLINQVCTSAEFRALQLREVGRCVPPTVCGVR